MIKISTNYKVEIIVYDNKFYMQKQEIIVALPLTFNANKIMMFI